MPVAARSAPPSLTSSVWPPLSPLGPRGLEADAQAALGVDAGFCLDEEVAKAMAAEGASVVVADRDDGQKVVEEIIAAGGTALNVVTDVSDETSCAAMATQTIDAFGPLGRRCRRVERSPPGRATRDARGLYAAGR